LIADKGMRFTEEDFQDLVDYIRKEINEGDYLVRSGDASNADPDIYSRIIKALEDLKLRVFIDASGKTLKDCVSLAPHLIKPNLDELSFLCNRNVTSNSDDVVSAIRSLSNYRLGVIAVSLGADGSIVSTAEGIYRAEPPKLKVTNTTGCGDCFLAGILYGYEKGLSIEETLRLATGASAAKAQEQLSVGFNTGKLNEYAALTKLHKIG
jgi:fructose-1-phosphate kinase PfkB-like protein